MSELVTGFLIGMALYGVPKYIMYRRNLGPSVNNSLEWAQAVAEREARERAEEQNANLAETGFYETNKERKNRELEERLKRSKELKKEQKRLKREKKANSED